MLNVVPSRDHGQPKHNEQKGNMREAYYFVKSNKKNLNHCHVILISYNFVMKRKQKFSATKSRPTTYRRNTLSTKREIRCAEYLLSSFLKFEKSIASCSAWETSKRNCIIVGSLMQPFLLNKVQHKIITKVHTAQKSN